MGQKNILCICPLGCSRGFDHKLITLQYDGDNFIANLEGLRVAGVDS